MPQLAWGANSNFVLEPNAARELGNDGLTARSAERDADSMGLLVV